MNMEKILSQLEEKKCWKSCLKTQCRRNGIDPSAANSFTIIKIKKFFQNPPQIESPNKPRMKSSVWLENQLKAYQWILICLSAVKGQLIKDFGATEWLELSQIFRKEEDILEYQAKKLISEKESVKKRWQEQESTLLLEIIQEEPDSNKWNQIARKLFVSSGKRFFRSGKQCRERWFNHLDPQKKRGQWQTTEDRFIAEFILEKGKKWSEIAKKLQNSRTEHMIKNRYKTILIKLRKQNPQLQSEPDLLRKLLSQAIEVQPIRSEIKELQQKKSDFNRVPVIEGDHALDFQFEIKEQQIGERVNPSAYEFQQVVTPCPIIYQNFTPTFLNTPHPVPFLCSFGKFQKNDNLFLK